MVLEQLLDIWRVSDAIKFSWRVFEIRSFPRVFAWEKHPQFSRASGAQTPFSKGRSCFSPAFNEYFLLRSRLIKRISFCAAGVFFPKHPYKSKDSSQNRNVLFYRNCLNRVITVILGKFNHARCPRFGDPLSRGGCKPIGGGTNWWNSTDTITSGFSFRINF